MENQKLVEFENYCSKCKHSEKAANEDPCGKCLTIPAREYSHKPEFFEQAEKKGNQNG